jgi:hypothetical protein
MLCGAQNIVFFVWTKRSIPPSVQAAWDFQIKLKGKKRVGKCYDYKQISKITKCKQSNVFR